MGIDEIGGFFQPGTRELGVHRQYTTLYLLIVEYDNRQHPLVREWQKFNLPQDRQRSFGFGCQTREIGNVCQEPRSVMHPLVDALIGIESAREA